MQCKRELPKRLSVLVPLLVFVFMLSYDIDRNSFINDAEAACYEDCGSGGGGTLWDRNDIPCTNTTSYTVCVMGVCTTVTETRTGNIIRCINGGQEQCNAQACDA